MMTKKTKGWLCGAAIIPCVVAMFVEIDYAVQPLYTIWYGVWSTAAIILAIAHNLLLTEYESEKRTRNIIDGVQSMLKK